MKQKWYQMSVPFKILLFCFLLVVLAILIHGRLWLSHIQSRVVYSDAEFLQSRHPSNVHSYLRDVIRSSKDSRARRLLKLSKHRNHGIRFAVLSAILTEAVPEDKDLLVVAESIVEAESSSNLRNQMQSRVQYWREKDDAMAPVPTENLSFARNTPEEGRGKGVGSSQGDGPDENAEQNALSLREKRARSE